METNETHSQELSSFGRRLLDPSPSLAVGFVQRQTLQDRLASASFPGQNGALSRMVAVPNISKHRLLSSQYQGTLSPAWPRNEAAGRLRERRSSDKRANSPRRVMLLNLRQCRRSGTATSLARISLDPGVALLLPSLLPSLPSVSRHGTSHPTSGQSASFSQSDNYICRHGEQISAAQPSPSQKRSIACILSHNGHAT